MVTSVCSPKPADCSSASASSTFGRSIDLLQARSAVDVELCPRGGRTDANIVPIDRQCCIQGAVLQQKLAGVGTQDDVAWHRVRAPDSGLERQAEGPALIGAVVEMKSLIVGRRPAQANAVSDEAG